MNRCAHALAAAGLAKGDRLALLSHNCWQFARAGLRRRPGSAWCWCRSTSCSAPTRSPSSSPIAARGASSRRTRLAADRRQGAGRRGCRRTAPRLDRPVRRGSPPTAGRTSAGWWREGSEQAPDVDVADDDPLRLMYTSGTESRPKGVMLSSRSLIASTSVCVIDGGMSADDVELHSLPMYHCAQLDCFFSVDVYLGATSIILPGPDPAALLATIARGEGDASCSARRRCGSRCCGTRTSTTTDLSSLRKGYYGASPMPVEVLARAAAPAAGRADVELLRPDRDGAAGHHPPAARAARAGGLGRPGGAERGDDARRRRRQPGARRARSARSCTAARTPRSATTTTRTRPPKPSAAAGSTPATSGS